ncbi:type II toxin-antitoxin system RelE/ParE family toxin [Bradyrhizobium sp. 200]|uniref:type II toxin-antitoxin system RelE/ParE family toxin n=1 Tax=Bradyrhizobium sp. 200 TaxID=2782665 RepID=UPI001FFF8C50|nr:type II toxin-antitoxin system RelE/ParE family toxin [Bradyrhizobium sp. 200]UPJ49253.1 type II toxin-antitoxin system RelE/ParE family toxin [Bradyrhizobium sp. 200]
MADHRLAIVWSSEALADIDHLWDYYAQVAGRGTADRILREIAKAVAVIDEFPLADRARDEIRSGLRSVAVAPQIVFYRLRDGRPEIVRVLDGRQDIEEIFSDGENG